MNYNKVIEILVYNLKSALKDKKAIIGISGGIDSAVVASLCVKAIGKENVIGIQMPYGEQSIKDGNILIDHLGIDNHIVDIKPVVYSFPKELVTTTKLTNGNIRARVRMILLYATSNELNGMVVGTGNKTEILLSYFTKWGDGGVDLEPIGDIYKTDIFEIAKILNVPKSIIEKKPSAELWKGQTDEGEIGMTYKEMDGILKGMELTEGIFYNRKLLEDIYGKEKVAIISKRMSDSEHKRHMPITFKIGDE